MNLPEKEMGIYQRKTLGSTTEGGALESTGGRNLSLPGEDIVIHRTKTSSLPEEEMKTTRGSNWNLPEEELKSTRRRNLGLLAAEA